MIMFLINCQGIHILYTIIVPIAGPFDKNPDKNILCNRFENL